MYSFRGFVLNEYCLDALDRYITKGIPPGGFLQAVLRNDLHGAVNHADDFNLPNLPAHIAYLVNKCPGACWGSVSNVSEWLHMEPSERAEHIDSCGYERR